MSVWRLKINLLPAHPIVAELLPGRFPGARIGPSGASIGRSSFEFRSPFSQRVAFLPTFPFKDVVTRLTSSGLRCRVSARSRNIDARSHVGG
jgi:hypothetical protein